MRTLVEQGEALAEAQEQALAGARVDLREAGRARADTLRRLTRAAEAVLDGQGSAAHRDEVVATLTAASSDPTSGALLLEGRLSEPLEAPSGFGGPVALPTVDAEAAPASESATPPPARRKKAEAVRAGREQEGAPATVGEPRRGRPGAGDAAPARATKARRARATAGPEEGGAPAVGPSGHAAPKRPRKGREATAVSDAGDPDASVTTTTTTPSECAPVADASPEDGAAEGPSRDRAPLRLVEDRRGGKTRGTPAAGTRRRVSDAGASAAGDDAPAGPAPALEAAAEAQADAARAATAADAVAERVAALEEELAQALAALADAEQEAGRRRRAAAAAVAAAQAAQERPR